MKSRLLLALLLLPLLAQADALSAIAYGNAVVVLLQVVGGGLCLAVLGVVGWRRYVAHQRDRAWRSTWDQGTMRAQPGSHLLRNVVLGALAVTVVVFGLLLWVG
jgi:hypothetical protein